MNARLCGLAVLIRFELRTSCVRLVLARVFDGSRRLVSDRVC